MFSLKGSLRASFYNTLRATTTSRYFKAFRVLSLLDRVAFKVPSGSSRGASYKATIRISCSFGFKVHAKPQNIPYGVNGV